ncbi:glycosyltransferase [Luteolibacter sp. AS25]|uniref:capsular polysaccharide export protein, LipB/KpsS family n=1 Tax=Luteolibacter sp. AS25 TaxID=3135776 RepID=UPI00398ADF0C
MKLTIVLLKPNIEISNSDRQAITKRFQNNIYFLSYSNDSGIIADEKLQTLTDRLAGYNDPLQIVLTGFTQEEQISQQALFFFASQKVSDIVRLEYFRGNPVFIPHRPLSGKQSDGLFVFPGPIIPISMGSHQRAFQMISTLLREGKHLDLLITASSPNHFNDVRSILLQISPNVHFYRNRKPQLRKAQAWRRKAESGVRILMKKTAPAPALFSERLQQAGTYAGRKSLARLLRNHAYKFVLVNYAWLDRILEHIPAELRSSTTFICDSHDVQFVRNDSDNKDEWRFLRNSRKERDSELAVLSKYDAVLAISESDEKTLKQHLGREKVIGVPTGFNYALDTPQMPDPNRPIFGFIGRAMDANIKSLEIVLKDWWPKIITEWPDAELRIAGSVCKTDFLKPFFNDDANIINDGFVANLQAWYRSIDVMLNPVAVQGGVNFKSIETIMSGRLLMTNELGLKCLGDDNLAVAAESGSEIVGILKEKLGDTAAYVHERARTQQLAKTLYDDTAAARQLLAFLNRSEKVEGTEKTTSPTSFLIQCGDSLENRTRLLPLAKELAALGLHPIVLVYSQKFVAPFIAAGVDAVALYKFTPSKAELSKAARRLDEEMDGLSIEDLTYLEQQQNYRKYAPDRLTQTLRDLKKSVYRVTSLVDEIKPDCIIVWNGYTGFPANVLRAVARKKNLPSFYLERSLFSDGVFIDPEGTNGASGLSRLTADDLRKNLKIEVIRKIEDTLREIPESEIAELRQSGPWAGAKTVIFIPLQVQNDSNIKLYSPEVANMTELINQAFKIFHGPDTAFVVRPHPEEVNTKKFINHRGFAERVPKDLDLSDVYDVYIDSGGNLDTWLAAADLVCTINSTVGLEALLRGKKTSILGQGIYSGKNLSNLNGVDDEGIEAFWKTLVSNHTSLPERPIPSCLDNIIPQNPRESREAFHNSEKINPWEYRDFWQNQGEKLRQVVSAADKTLTVVIPEMTKLKLNLSYRKDKEELTEEWIEKRCRDQFSISVDTELIITTIPPDSGYYILVGSEKNETHLNKPLMLVDPYMWPLPIFAKYD